MSNEFIIKPRKKIKKNKPTIEVGQVIKTIHGDITVLSYANNTNVLVEFADKTVQPNPQYHTVAWIRRNEIKDEKK